MSACEHNFRGLSMPFTPSVTWSGHVFKLEDDTLISEGIFFNLEYEQMQT